MRRVGEAAHQLHWSHKEHKDEIFRKKMKKKKKKEKVATCVFLTQPWTKIYCVISGFLIKIRRRKRSQAEQAATRVCSSSPGHMEAL